MKRNFSCHGSTKSQNPTKENYFRVIPCVGGKNTDHIFAAKKMIKLYVLEKLHIFGLWLQSVNLNYW